MYMWNHMLNSFMKTICLYKKYKILACNNIAFWFKKMDKCSPPISIAMIEKIFSFTVFGETFPKPTLVKLVVVK